MKVWIIRHGESESNRDGLWTGWLDAPLTEQGRADAASVRGLLSNVSFDKIYSSDLLRAECTAKIAIPGCKYETDPALREINVGNLAGKPLDAVKDNSGKPANKDGYAIFGGESSGDFHARVAGFMHRLEGLNYSNVAIFSHAGWLRTALDFAVGIRLPRKNICCNNCAAAVFEYSDSIWKLHSWINLE